MTTSLPKEGKERKARVDNVTIDRPRIKYRKPEPTLLRGILGRTLEKYGIDKDIARYQFVLYWKKIMGADAAARAVPECIRGNTLVVRVANSAWAQELSFQKATILSRLKKYAPDTATITDVRFYVN